MDDGPASTSTTAEPRLVPLQEEAEDKGLEVLAAGEGEATSRREAPRHIQHHHPPQFLIGNLDEITTRSRSRQISHFALLHSLPLFSPEMLNTLYLIQIGSIPCMRILRTLREIGFGFWLSLHQIGILSGQNGCSKTNKGKMGWL